MSDSQIEALTGGHHAAFMAAAEVKPGEVVVDVGCGAGQTTIEAAISADGAPALGVDLSHELLDVARRRAADAGVATASFVRADAQVHDFDAGAADVVLGRTSAMFFSDHAAAFSNLRGALKRGGRMVLLTWQPLDGNEWLRIIGTALSPVGPPCVSAYQGRMPGDSVPHYVPEQNPFVDEMTERYGVPRDAALGMPETLYPEYRKKMKPGSARPDACTVNCTATAPPAQR